MITSVESFFSGYINSQLIQYICNLKLTCTAQGPEVEHQWTIEWDGQIVFAHGNNHLYGVAIAILFKSKFDYEIEESKVDNEGRYLFTEAKIQTATSPF